MKPFIKNILVFLAPLSLIVSFPLIALIYCGEIFINLRHIAIKDEKYIFGVAYSEVGRQFKFVNVSEKEKSNVIALGSSRVMQFRANMFNKSFYNAGGCAQSIYEYESFLRALPKEKLPKYLIIGLDQWMFNIGYQKNYEGDQGKISWNDLSSINENITGKVKNFISDYASGKIENIFEKSNYKLYGINAVVENNGFRNDGSYYYKTFIRKLISRDTSRHDYKFRMTLDRIRKGCCRFDAGNEVNSNAIMAIGNLLSFANSNSINVIAFFPPFASTISNELVRSGRYTYLDKIYPAIKPIFDKYDFEIYDYLPMESISKSNDNQMIDGFHGGEVTYTKILIEMLKSGSILNECADKKKLESDLLYAKNNYIVYDY